MKEIRTLAMIKMEKNFIAHLEKGYSRQPYMRYTTERLMDRLDEEVKELKSALLSLHVDEAKKECADISNLIDFIFERLADGKLK